MRSNVYAVHGEHASTQRDSRRRQQRYEVSRLISLIRYAHSLRGSTSSTLAAVSRTRCSPCITAHRARGGRRNESESTAWWQRVQCEWRAAAHLLVVDLGL